MFGISAFLFSQGIMLRSRSEAKYLVSLSLSPSSPCLFSIFLCSTQVPLLVWYTLPLPRGMPSFIGFSFHPFIWLQFLTSPSLFAKHSGSLSAKRCLLNALPWASGCQPFISKLHPIPELQSQNGCKNLANTGCQERANLLYFSIDI